VACEAERVALIVTGESTSLADRPSTKPRKPVSTLPPQMNAVLVRAVFSNVARALFSNGLVIGEQAKDSLERPLVHSSRLGRRRPHAQK
jgi:hypothetical protein